MAIALIVLKLCKVGTGFKSSPFPVLSKNLLGYLLLGRVPAIELLAKIKIF